jgi:hypothetical protein
MILYALCVVFVYSYFDENCPIWSWETNPYFFRGFYHSWYQSQVQDKTHTKASKNCNNVVGEECLAHISTIVVSLGGKLTYVFFYATTELHQWRYVVNFGLLILFYCWWPYFVVCGFSRTIRACGHLLLLFMMIILLFVFSCRTLMWKAHYGDDLKSLLYGDVSDKPMMGMFDSFSVGILTPLER